MKKEPDKKKRLEQNSVRIVIDVLENRVFPKHQKKIYLFKKKIDQNPKNMYFKIFLKIFKYMYELRGPYKNPIRSMIEDYAEVVFKTYKEYGRKPALTNFSPSANNRVRFEEWIDNYHRDYGEEYFISDWPEPAQEVRVGEILVEQDIEITEV